MPTTVAKAFFRHFTANIACNPGTYRGKTAAPQLLLSEAKKEWPAPVPIPNN